MGFYKQSDVVPRDHVKMEIFIPKSLYALLDKISLDRGIPKVRLVNIAIDNEFDQVKPFNYPTMEDMEKIVYEEYLYASEARKILNYMTRNRKGFGVEQLLILRRDIGIEDREAVLGGIKDLDNQNLIKRVRPAVSYFNYYKTDYRVFRLNSLTKDFKKRFRKVDGARSLTRRRSIG